MQVPVHGVAVCGGCSLWGLQCVGLQCVEVVAWGQDGYGLKCVGVVFYGSCAVIRMALCESCYLGQSVCCGLVSY